MIWILCPIFLLGVLYALYLFKKVCLKHFERLLSCCHPLPVLLFTFHTKSQPGCWTDSATRQTKLNVFEFSGRICLHHSIFENLFSQKIHFTKQAILTKNIKKYYISYIKIPSKLEVPPPPKCGLGEWVIPLRLLRLLEHLAVLIKTFL